MPRPERQAPIRTFVNVSGGEIRAVDDNGRTTRYFSRGAAIELRPEHEKLTDRQRERQAELVKELSKDPRFAELPQRDAGFAEQESESVGKDE